MMNGSEPRISGSSKHGDDLVWRRPRSWQVIGLWTLSVVILSYMYWQLIPELEEVGKSRLLDLRPFGYSLEEARGLLYYLNKDGRLQDYLFPYLALDMVLAPCFALALTLGSLRLLHQGLPFSGRAANVLMAIAVVMPVMGGLFDIWENWLLYQVIEQFLDIRAADIVDLKRATSFKFGFYLFGFISFFLIFVISLLHRKKQCTL